MKTTKAAAATVTATGKRARRRTPAEAIQELIATKPRGSWTVADYMALPDDGNRYEVLEGNLVMCSCPNRWHQKAQMNLIRILLRHVDATKCGELYAAPFDVVFEPSNCCQPDLLFVATKRLSIIDERNVKGAPDLAVEILSANDRKRDRVTKKGIYCSLGVAHYWIVDPDDGILEEYVLSKSGAYEASAALEGADAIFRPKVFPGLEIELKEVFAR